MSAPRSFAHWMLAYEIVADAPAAFKAERMARGESITSAARQIVMMTPYRLRKFEEGRDIPTGDLRSILIWMAGHRVPADDGSSSTDPEASA